MAPLCPVLLPGVRSAKCLLLEVPEEREKSCPCVFLPSTVVPGHLHVWANGTARGRTLTGVIPNRGS